jgi:cobalt/nickel transport system ATP-binding protein
MISLRDVSFSYADAPALAHIDLAIGRGEALALIGPNGSGKSTLLKLLTGIVHPDSGTYHFDGEEISRARFKDPRLSKVFHQRVGFLFQNSDAQLFCTSVYDEIAFGPRQMGLSEGQIEQRVMDSLGLLQIEDLSRRIPYHLSGGEKRKVALASVLALNPDVLVLDEPMNALDPRTKHFLRDFLISMHAAGKTIVCATQDFEYVDGVFDHVAVFSMRHEIARTGAYAEILGDRGFLKANNII